MTVTASPTMPARDPFGCPAGKLHDDRMVMTPGLRFCRRRSPSQTLGRVETDASDRGVLVGVALRGGHRRTIFHEHGSTSHLFEEGDIYVRPFSTAYRADLDGPFDFLLLEASIPLLASLREELGAPMHEEIRTVTAVSDLALAGMVKAMLPVLDAARPVCRLVLDQLGIAIGAHLLRAYGADVPEPPQRRLSRPQEARAKELLLARLNGEIAIGDVAQACGLSRSYFTRAFRETTGETPYRWLQQQRLERACDYMRGSRLPLSEIATACGFSDQSHMTRLFTRRMGCPPGLWRRRLLE